MANIPKGTKRILKALAELSQEQDEATREGILQAGFKKFIKWFSMAANIIRSKKVKLPKQTQAFMDRHKHDLTMLGSKTINDNEKRSIILKRGGSGFLGGVIIRSFLNWNGGAKAKAKPS